MSMNKEEKNNESEEFNGVDYIWVPEDDFVDEFLVEWQESEFSKLTMQTASEAAEKANAKDDELWTMSIKVEELHQKRTTTQTRTFPPRFYVDPHLYKRPRLKVIRFRCITSLQSIQYLYK